MRSKRAALKVPAASGWRGGGHPWTAEEIALLGTGTGTDAAVAKKIGRTPAAVSQKRAALGVAPARLGGRK